MDPAALKPTSRFAAPNRALSPSPSRSPSRRLPSHELDPLLSNLSPTLTLEALEATQAVESGGNSLSSILRDSVAAATTSERALGIRAALAAKKTREWYHELMEWPWPSPDGYHNGFDCPPGHDESRNMGKHVYPKRLDELWPSGEMLRTHDNAGKEGYYGSLPEIVVQEYEDRIETISDDIESLGIDELKDYVRDIHLTAGSARSSLQASEPNSGYVTTYNRLDDFTAVITATIMQALPTITQLYLLLDTWSVRLMILRRVPNFLTCLEEAQTAVKSAWHAVGKSEFTTEHLESFITREAFATMRTVLGNKITELGRILDGMLDMLEGREDVLPERWIESMDILEVEFGTWVVETENQVLKNELKNGQSNEDIEAIDQNSHIKYTEIQDPPLDARASESQPGIGPSERHLTEDIRNTPDAKSKNQCSARSVSPAIQGHEYSDPSDRKANESNGAAPGAVNVLADSYSGSFLPKLRSETSAVCLGSAESKTITAGSVNDLSTGLLGYGNQSQEVLPHVVPTSESSETQEHSIFGTDGTESPDGNIDAVKVASGSTVNPQNLATSTPLPLKSKLDILDTLEAELLEQKHGPAARPGPLVFQKSHSRALSNISSDMSPNSSYPGSATSEYFSNMSSPELRDASRAEYFAGPIEVTTPSYSSKDPISPNSTVSRQSSQRTERGDSMTNEGDFSSSYAFPTTQRSRASTVKKELGTNDIAGFKDGFFPSPAQLESGLRTRSASTVSVEAAPKGAMRNDGTKRAESYSSASPSLRQSQNEYLGSGQPLTSARLSLQQEESARTTPKEPIQLFELNKNYESTLGSRSKKYVKDSTNQPSLDSPPLIPPKSRHRFQDVADLGPGSTPIRVRQRNREANIATPESALQLSNRTPTKSSDDQLEARISSILTDIPAHIRLTSGPEADAPEVFRPEDSQDPHTPATGPPATRLSRSQSSVSSPPMTLAPAHPNSSKVRAQHGDPEIKLYHLHQSGKVAPIKLYIRLVGENGERVMVRVGGGWADLREYLKEYAGHHGRRSGSDGRFEIQGFPQSQSSSPITSLTGHSSSHNTPRSEPVSPSMLNTRNRRLSEPAPSEFETPMTPDSLTYARQNSAAKSRDSSPASIRPSSRHSWTEDDPPLGLAGPRIKKVEISPRKQAWVDGMVNQAKNTSAEKNKLGDGDFGGLGKVGGTKRLFLKPKKDG